MAQPIWKDYVVRMPLAGDYADYHILCDGEAIFFGRAYKMPGEETIDVKINDICAEYLRQVSADDLFNAAATERQYLATPYIARTFTVFSGESEEPAATIEFYMDWSYRSDYTYPTVSDDEWGANAPISREISPLQFVFFSFYRKSGITLVAIDGTPRTKTIGPEASGGGPWTGVVNMGQFPGATALTSFAIANQPPMYTVTQECARYALYYVNAFGGWDSLLLRGSVKEVDNITRQTIKRVYNNDDPVNRGTANYRNDIAKSYKVNTGWLSESQSARMFHLLESTEVFLHDLAEGVVRPVVLTDKALEYKNYKADGAQLINYTLDVEIAQNFTRL